jgi:hypothetical protein
LSRSKMVLFFLSITTVVKPHVIPQCASISYVLDLIELFSDG